MKGIKTLAVLVGLATIAIVASDASAYYHPRLGRFLSRDPGSGGPMRVGAARPVVGGGFAPRDPTGSNQYADGMSLYEYERGNPVGVTDPSGLKVGDLPGFIWPEGVTPETLGWDVYWFPPSKQDKKYPWQHLAPYEPGEYERRVGERLGNRARYQDVENTYIFRRSRISCPPCLLGLPLIAERDKTTSYHRRLRLAFDETNEYRIWRRDYYYARHKYTGFLHVYRMEFGMKRRGWRVLDIRGFVTMVHCTYKTPLKGSVTIMLPIPKIVMLSTTRALEVAWRQDAVRRVKGFTTFETIKGKKDPFGEEKQR